ncbi:TonB-dependent receptor [Neisseria montereyensis]|uniref:TonB-dependent siderophore receptor n=1 Tax=Neisseria montereyensis TaxID=2973938 RepID=A0ABT2FB60_9NEIS|nr:TonB-dependent siderophore receptor [Neisseria montereyensis]MCS4533411.1 TonB-dependent siderophore receptor [Neisseria montereyensis]
MKKKTHVIITSTRKNSMALGVGLLAATMNPALAADSTTELGTINVRDNRPIRSGYEAPDTTIGKRLQDVQEIPQSATVINQQLMKDQATSDLKSALKNAGITFQAGEGGQAEVPIIRGFHAGGDVFEDGMRGSSAQFNTDTFNTDHVEVLKGSAGILFGRGVGGGVINQVSKMPYLGTGGDVAVGFGSRSYKRFTGDYNHAFNDNVAVRLNIMGEGRDSFRKPVDTKKFGIAPTVSFGLSGDTRLDLGYKYIKEDNTPDLGVTYRRTGPATAVADDRYFNTNIGYPGLESEKSYNQVATAKLTHKFNDNASIDNTLRYSKTKFDSFTMAPRLNPDGTQVRRIFSDYKTIIYNADTWSNLTNFNYKFDTGGIKHDLLTTLELIREKRDTYRPAHVFTIDGNPAALSDGLPYNIATGTFAPGNVTHMRLPVEPTVTKTNTVGLGVSDIIELTPTVKAVAGVRYNHIKTKNRAATDGQEVSRSDNLWTYTGSLIWDYLPGRNVYATYSTSAMPVTFRVIGAWASLDPSQLVSAPERTRTFEIGTKNSFFDDALTVNAALFHTRKTNQYVRNAGFADEVKVYGLDAGVTGRITDRLNLISNVVISNGKVRADDPATFQLNDKFPEAAAKVTANMWANYRVTNDINTGLGIRYVGKRYTYDPNILQKLPSYTLVDAMVSYENRNYRAQLNVNNLFDKKYFESGIRPHAFPGERRTILATFGYKF